MYFYCIVLLLIYIHHRIECLNLILLKSSIKFIELNQDQHEETFNIIDHQLSSLAEEEPIDYVHQESNSNRRGRRRKRWAWGSIFYYSFETLAMLPIAKSLYDEFKSIHGGSNKDDDQKIKLVNQEELLKLIKITNNKNHDYQIQPQPQQQKQISFWEQQQRHLIPIILAIIILNLFLLLVCKFNYTKKDNNHIRRNRRRLSSKTRKRRRKS